MGVTWDFRELEGRSTGNPGAFKCVPGMYQSCSMGFQRHSMGLEGVPAPFQGCFKRSHGVQVNSEVQRYLS